MVRLGRASGRSKRRFRGEEGLFRGKDILHVCQRHLQTSCRSEMRTLSAQSLAIRIIQFRHVLEVPIEQDSHLEFIRLM